MITVYELLGKIKNGEIPKHIHLLPYSENNPIAGKYTYQDEDYLKDGWENVWLFKGRLFKHLNDEVEILEENKIPEETTISEEQMLFNNLTTIDQEYIIRFMKMLQQPIDYLKSKGE